MLTKLILLKSNNILRALSFESSLFESSDFQIINYILFWISNPCVVIGRHQNPWKEINIPLLKEKNLYIVRRASGGGTVYHDLGNLNISFLSSKNDCNRNLFMNIVANAINKNWNKSCYVGQRHEIYTSNSLKVSGSASRFGRSNAFHHCTLLLNADLEGLSKILLSELNIETNATKSVTSSVTNLHLNYEEVIKVIHLQYLENFNHKTEFIEIDNGFETDFVDSTVFEKNLNLFSSNKWIYGGTPIFTIKSSVKIDNFSADINVSCEKAVIHNISISNEYKLSDHFLDVINEHFVGLELIENNFNHRLQLARAKLEFLNFGNFLETDEYIFTELKRIFYNL